MMVLFLQQLCYILFLYQFSVVGRCIPSIFKDMADYAATLTDGSNNIQTKDGTDVNGNLMDEASEYVSHNTCLMSHNVDFTSQDIGFISHNIYFIFHNIDFISHTIGFMS